MIKTRGACSLTSETLCFGDDDCPLAETCIKDTTKVDAAVEKCETKFNDEWGKLEAAAAKKSEACPDGLLTDEIKNVLDEHGANIAAALAGEGFFEDEELSTCEDGLAACACDAVPQGQLLQTGQTQCWDVGGWLISCPGTEHDGDLQKGLTASFTDNSDGTISDHRTGLMWERLNDDGAINDKDRTFTWADAFNKVKVLNGNPTGCIAAGDPSSCCTGAGTGSGCTAFAGHTDWRLPNLFELESLRNLGAYFGPATHAAFDSSCTTNCTTCSCTEWLFYWSATTSKSQPRNAWSVLFVGGTAMTEHKANSWFVRAVRGGS